MSGSGQQVPVTTSPLGGQGGIQVKEYNRSFSVMVAMMLARARREFDSTDDITAAVANVHISQPAPPANQPNPPHN